MAFNKWLTTGELDNANGEALTPTNLNDMIDEVVPPIGAIIAWAKSFTGVPATLPSGWVECDGSVLSDADSPLNGETLPDLQTGNEFLRGNSTSGGTGGAKTHTHSDGSHNHTSTFSANTGGPTKTEGYGGGTHTHSSTNHEPPYYDVVWIIRVK